MAGTIDVDPAAVAQLGGTCVTTSSEIARIVQTLGGQVRNVHWRSTAKQKFDADWAQHESNLRRLMVQLEEIGGAAKQMGQNYSDADAAYKGGA